MDFSNKLKELRKSKHITQEELAKSIFLSRSVIAKYEAGSALPTKENIEKLSLFFSVESSYFMDERNDVIISKSEYKIRGIISYIISILGLIVNSIYIVVFFIPIFSRLEYIYPIPEELDKPLTKYVYNSIFSVFIEKNNIIGIITFVFCIIDILLIILFMILKKRKCINLIFEFMFILLLIINVFLMVFTFFISASYAL